MIDHVRLAGIYELLPEDVQREIDLVIQERIAKEAVLRYLKHRRRKWKEWSNPKYERPVAQKWNPVEKRDYGA